MATIPLSTLGYNTHLFGENLISKIGGTFYQDDLRSQIIQTKINSSGADTVGLVEVWSNTLATNIINGVREVYPYSYRPPVDTSILNLKPMGHGLLLLSKYPLSEQNFYHYNNLSGFDDFSLKGILTAKAELPNPSAGGNPIKVRFFLTHTQAAYTNNSYETIRLANIGQLADTVRDYQTGRAYNKDTDIPIFTFGDFNVIAEIQATGEQTSEYQKMMNFFEEVQLTDSYRKLHGNFNQFPGYTYFSDGVNQPNKLITKFASTDAKDKVHQRLDYIFYSQKGSAITVTPTEAQVLGGYTYPDGGEDMDLSDHEPLWGKFNLEI
jgi:exonuclease III